VFATPAANSLSERPENHAAALIRSLRRADLWPPVIPTMVLVESLQARLGRDAVLNQFIGTCLIEDSVPMTLARRAAELRRRARKGSAVDALVSALAEPNGAVLTGDVADLGALAAQTNRVTVVGV
jgi:predicted nucleic acid-binding protein